MPAYLPLDEMGGTIFFQLVSARYEHRSIILTSNKSHGDWGSIFGECRLLPCGNGFAIAPAPLPSAHGWVIWACLLRSSSFEYLVPCRVNWTARPFLVI